VIKKILIRLAGKYKSVDELRNLFPLKTESKRLKDTDVQDAQK
jgi:hypothetical protein